MSITDITRSLNQHSADRAFHDIAPDSIHVASIRSIRHPECLARDPLKAGNTLHHLLARMADKGPLSDIESTHFPWVSSLRRLIWALGAYKMDIDVALSAYGQLPNGTCDLLVHGGPRRQGIVEVKVILKGSQQSPRARDLVQLASYARLHARNGSFDDLWAAVAYLELEARKVRLMTFNSARGIIEPTLALIQAA